MKQQQKAAQFMKLSQQAAQTGQPLSQRQTARMNFLNKQQNQPAPDRGALAGAALGQVRTRLSPGVYGMRPPMAPQQAPQAPQGGIDPGRMPQGQPQQLMAPQPSPYSHSYNPQAEMYNDTPNIGFNPGPFTPKGGDQTQMQQSQIDPAQSQQFLGGAQQGVPQQWKPWGAGQQPQNGQPSPWQRGWNY